MSLFLVTFLACDAAGMTNGSNVKSAASAGG
jgi:hypothetical protein